MRAMHDGRELCRSFEGEDAPRGGAGMPAEQGARRADVLRAVAAALGRGEGADGEGADGEGWAEARAWGRR